MPKMPKVKQAFIAFDSELRTGARQRAPTNSELFLDADERRFSGFKTKYRRPESNKSTWFCMILLPQEGFICVDLRKSVSY